VNISVALMLLVKFGECLATLVNFNSEILGNSRRIKGKIKVDFL